MPILCSDNLCWEFKYRGTGKTPHVEYLVRLLVPHLKMATLSRGYKRKTSGFILANNLSSSLDIGDEPRQYKTKFPELAVAVCEDRCEGARNILQLNPDTNCIILDDAFQHRSLKAGLNILLTDCTKLFTRDHVLPAGTLREFRSGAKRANIIVVTKCSETLSDSNREKIRSEIKPNQDQHLFFSYFQYGPLIKLNDPKTEANISISRSAVLFSGIANIKPLKEYLIKNNYSLQILNFSDHHQFSSQDLMKVRDTFNNIADKNAIIITTEKDAMRIETAEQKEIMKDLPVYYLPVFVEFFPSDKEMFNKLIMNHTNA